MNATSSQLPQRALKKGAGRPRRLTIDQILEAAQAIGLDGLTMGAVADKLGVRITLLYGYVANKEELVRLVAARVSTDSPFPKDVGQSWQDYIMEHGAVLYQLLTGPGQLIAQYFAGGLGPEVELDRIEAWLEVLVEKGLTAEQALNLYRQTGEIIIGAAVTALHISAVNQSGATFQEASQLAMQKRGSDQLPLMASVYSSFLAQKPMWQQSILALLKMVTAERGEVKSDEFWLNLQVQYEKRAD